MQGRWLRRFAPKSEGLFLISSYFLQTPLVGYADSVSLRLGRIAALTVHRTAIHYRADTALPYRDAEADPANFSLPTFLFSDEIILDFFRI